MILKDKVIIVTGGAIGIGKAYSKRLAREGAKVVIADIVDGSILEKEINSCGGDSIAIHTDVTDEKSIKEMVDKTIKKFGKTDGIINNAAFFSKIVRKPFYEITSEEWDKVMEVNVKGIFLCVKAIFPYMRERGKGKIINISSATAFKGGVSYLHSVTSKAAVIGLTRALAREVGDYGICVNAIAPGFTLTEGRTITPEKEKESSIARCFKRLQYPEDIEGTVVFLCSDDSDFITGQTIVVDGGNVTH